MKKLIILLIILSSFHIAKAQYGFLMDRYYISGSLSLGTGNRAFADSSCWLQLGNDTTNKGMILPRVVLDSIHNTKRALFVYDLKDSVLYHFDGSKRVRYMTYKDTVLIKEIAARTSVDTSRLVKYADTATMLGSYLRTNNATLDKVLTMGNTSTQKAVTGGLTIDKSTASAKLAIVSDNDQSAVINIKQSADHSANTWDLTSASTSHDFSLYNYTAGKTALNVKASSNNLMINTTTDNGNQLQVNGSGTYTGALKLKGYSGAMQPSAAIGMANGALIGWAGSTDPSGNLKTAIYVDGADNIACIQSGNDLYRYSSGSHVFTISTSGEFDVKGTGRSNFCVVAGNNNQSQIRFMENGYNPHPVIYKQPGQSNLFIDNNVSGYLNTMLHLSSNGDAQIGGAFLTNAPSANGAGSIKIGKILTGSDSNNYLEVMVDGSIFYIRALTLLP